MADTQKIREEIEALDAEIRSLHQGEDGELREFSEDEQATFDAKRAERAKKMALLERHEAIEKAAALPERNVHTFEAPAVHVKNDPFENLDDLQWRSDKDPSLRDRALRAFEDGKQRGVSDEDRAEVVRKIESVPGAARHALLVGSEDYREAFTEVMRAQGGQAILTPAQAGAMRAAMSLTAGNGGYLLPTLLDPSLIHTGTAVKDPIRRLATVKTGTVNVWNGVTVGNVTTYWTAEAVTTPEGSPTLTGPSVTARRLTAWLTGSYEVFEDTGLASDLPGLITEAMSYKEQAAFVSGDGTSAPKGIVTAISATAGSTVTATTRGAFTSASAADIFAVVNALPTRFEDSSTWVANKATFNTIRQMSTASQGSFFWTNFNDAVVPGAQPLLGYPVAQASDMATAQTSGTVLAVLGDFSRYVIYDRIGIQVEFVQNVFDQATGLPTGQRGYVAHKRVGGDCVDINAFRFLKT